MSHKETGGYSGSALVSYRLKRRVTFGFAVGLGLLAVAAGAGAFSLWEVSGKYRRALGSERDDFASVLLGEHEVRGAQINYLRYLADPDERFVEQRDSLLANARRLFEQSRNRARDAETREIWATGLRNLAAWEEASDRAIVARRAGDITGALRIHNSEVVSARNAQWASVLPGIQQAQATSKAEAAAAAKLARDATWALILGGLVALTIGVVTSWLLVRGVSRPLATTATTLASTAAEILEATVHQDWSVNRVAEEAASAKSLIDAVTSGQTLERAGRLERLAGRVAELDEATAKELSDALRRESRHMESVVKGREASLAEIQERIIRIEKMSQRTRMSTRRLERIARRLNREGFELLEMIRGASPGEGDGDERSEAAAVEASRASSHA